MFKVKLIIPIVAVMSLMLVVKSNAQDKNNTLSVISSENLTIDKVAATRIFTLYQNEQTQFTNVTKVKFDLCKEADVILNVKDNQGKIVEKLIDGSLQPGQYNVYYKSPDEFMYSELSYVIEVDGVSCSKNFIIVK